jgi:preprotein translocase subunit YajC
LIPFLAQSSSTTTQAANPLATLLPFLLIGAALYFVMIRPQQRRAKEQRALLGALEVGDDVLTAGGIFGTIVDIDDDDVVTVEIAPGTNIRMVRGGISRRLVDDDEDYEDDDEDDDEGVDAES